MCQNVLEKIEEDPDFINSIVTCEESWLFQYGPETKRQSKQWKTTHSLRPKKGTYVKIEVDNARSFLRYSRNYYDSVRTNRSNTESDVLH
jgi:hypothetical protein